LSLLFHSAFCLCFFLFPDPAFSPIYTLSLHDALPICLFSTLSICSRRVVICGIRFCCFLVWSVCCMARFFLRILEQKDSRTIQKISLPPRGLFLLLVTEPVSELALTVFAALELDLDTGMNRNSPVIHIGQITWLGPIALLKRDI